ncbi:MAG: nitroreductase [Firmicutes bacterium]|nr:nitroreductase [Bacillota bacterium]
MELIQVNQEKCIKCGICGKVCPIGIIQLKTEWPEAVDPESCIACGHCVVSCPHEALDNVRSPLAQQTPLTDTMGIENEKAYQFLRSRRSIRNYEKKPVPREKLMQLMDIARFAPTASNFQSISYVIVEDPQILQGITNLVNDWMKEQSQAGSYWAKRYEGVLKRFQGSGTDTVLRNAPCLIIATAPKGLENGRDNAKSSLTYVELYAPTLGLGTCWAGLLQMCAFSGYKPLLELLSLPEDREFSGAIIAGYPQYRYNKLVDRNPLQIEFK